MRRLLKWLAILLALLLLLILCAVLISYYLLGTERGFGFTVDKIEERVEGLTIGSVNGSLKNGIQTDQVDYQNEQLTLKAKGVNTQWRSDCLVDKALCIDKVIVDDLNVELFATEEKNTTASTDDIILPDIKLPISFNAKEVLIKNLSIQPPGDVPAHELKNIKLSAKSDHDRILIDELSTQYKNISLKTSGAITPTGAYPIDLNTQVQLTDFIEEFDAKTTIKLSNTVEELDINVLLTGAVSASATGRIQPLRKKLPARLNIKTSQAGWPLDTNQLAQVNDLSLVIDGDMDDYAVRLQTHVKGESIPDSKLDVTGVANTDRAVILDFSANTLNGLATGNGAVSWEDGVTWLGEVKATDIDPSVKFEGVTGKLNGLIDAKGDLADGKWTLDLRKAQIDGVLRNVPFKLDTKLVKHFNGAWQLDSLVLNNGGNQVNAKGQLTDKWDLEAEVKLPELQNLLPDLTGGFNATVNLKGDLKNPDAKIRATSTGIKFNEVAISGLALNANINRGAIENSDLTLNVNKVQSGEQSARNMKLKFNGSLSRHTLALFADGPQKTSVDLLAAGGLNEKYDWNGLLDKVKLEVPAHAITLTKPTTLAWINDTKKFSIEPHCWSIQESNLCLKNQVLAQNKGKAKIELDAYRLEQLNPFLPAESNLRGNLNADLVFDWGAEIAGGFAATLDAGVTGGAINVVDTSGVPLSFEYDTLTLKSAVDAEAIDSKLTIDSNSMGQAKIDLKLDTKSEKQNINGNVDLSGFKIGFIKAFLPDYDEISGQISAKGKLSGELLDPLYNGDVVLSSLVVRSKKLPVAIDDGKLTALITGKRTQIDGQLNSGDGTIGVSGSANWRNDTYRADIKINAKQLNVVQEPLTSSTVNAKLTVSATPARVRVRGNVDVPAAAINIKELPRSAATLSEDVIVVEDVYAQTQEEQKKKAAATNLDLKVNVNLGDNVTLAGYGMNASLTGNMSLAQSSPNPMQFGGEVTIVSGIYKQYGQDLKITDGQVLFVGPIDQTTLNIDAVREVEAGSRIAGLHIDGRIEDPEISLFTEPADKTQESILSYIVLGRDIGDNSSQEKNLLAAAAIALTVKGGNAITDNLAESLGIQEISIDARGRDDTTELVVSGQVNDRLLLRYGQSVFDDSYTLYLRYDLAKQLYLEAAGGAAGVTKAIDIVYSFSF